MLNAGQSGFAYAPISKIVITLVVLTTVFGSIIGSQSRLTLRIPQVKDNLHLWRLLTHNFVFTTPGELLFGVVLLYYFRQLERQLGSSRFAAFTLITCSIYTALLVTLQILLPSTIPASGPYSLIFASMVFFYFETPKVYHFQVLGAFALSDKSFAYILTLQLVFSSPSRSLISCAVAIISGICYRLPGIRENAEMPEPLVTFCSNYILPFIASSSRSSSSRRSRHYSSAATNSRRRANVGLLTQNGITAISESNLNTLVAMGFSRDQCISALQRSNDDVQRATDMLLSGA